MSKTPVYVSFDYDNDRVLKEFVIGQSKLDDSPFEVIDHSIKEAVSGDWISEAEKRIKRSDVVLIIVGPKTYSAQGVLKEVQLANRHGKRIVQVIGYRNTSPTPVPNAGRLYTWSWPNMKTILR